MSSRKIKDLTKSTRDKYLCFRERMEAEGLPFILTCTARTETEQVALFCQGRLSLQGVNCIRRLAGLPPITATANRFCVTKTLNSKHIVHKNRPLAEAFDIALLKHQRPHWDIKVNVNKNEVPDYLEAARIGEECGLVAGAFFKRLRDYPHFQDRGAL